jgi:hypothetical protein
MATKNQNEKQYDSWIETKRGRLYQKTIIGRRGWKSVYHKETDNDENTIRFWQEIRDENDVLREIHEKYPVDKGHIKL